MFMNQLNDLVDQPIEGAMVVEWGGVAHGLDDPGQVGHQ